MCAVAIPASTSSPSRSDRYERPAADPPALQHGGADPPSRDQLPLYNRLRSTGRLLADAINECVPAGPDRDAAIRKVREAVMIANAGIACASYRLHTQDETSDGREQGVFRAATEAVAEERRRW